MSRPKYTGYLFVDHRASPGIPGQPKLVERDTQHCSHCNIPVILNPLRQRERFICPRCDWYCCDICAAAYKLNERCKPFNWVAEEVQTGKMPFPILAKDMMRE